MKKCNLFLLVLLAAFSFQACNNNSDSQANADSAEKAKGQNENNTAIKADDSNFMIKAASGGMMEVQLGQMAQQKSQNPRVKSFGAMMVKDHTQANNDLKALAANKNIAIPGSLSEEHQKHVSDMEKATGKKFDNMYMSMMVDDHKEDIGDFEKASNNASDADIKAFAAKTLPVLRTHLDSAQAVNSALK